MVRLEMTQVCKQTGLTWAWELTSPEPISEGKRQDWERQLERDREKEVYEGADGDCRGLPERQ